MVDKVKISPRYLTYDEKGVQRILDSVKTIDATPTAGSEYPVASGGVQAALTEIEANVRGGLDDKLGYEEDSDPMGLVEPEEETESE